MSNLNKLVLTSAMPLFFMLSGFAYSQPLPASPSSANPADFVQIRDGKFQLAGKPFVLRGTNYFGSWRERSTISAGGDVVHGTVWGFYDDWAPKKVEMDFQFLRSQLNATAVRIGTPAQSDFASLVQHHGFQPWYNPDGTITDRYRKELTELADIAYRNNVRIQLCLLWNVSGEIAKDGDAFKPGGKMDAFYSKQVRSIASALKNHPGVIAYSVGNEVLVIWKTNGTHTSWFEPRAGGFILRRLRDLREAAPLQLLTVDECASPGAGTWHSPGPEFAVLPDVDDCNRHQAFRLIDKVDYLGAHFYPETLKTEDLRGDAGWKLDDAVQKLAIYMQAAKAEGKPVVLDEFGLKLNPETMNSADYWEFRDNLFERVLAAGQTLGLQGALPWLALPGMILRPGHFSIEPSKENPSSSTEIRIENREGGMQRILFYKPHFSLFTWDANGDTPKPTRAAKAIATAWPEIPLPTSRP